MTKEEIIEMAREANLPSCLATYPKALERFAKLIAEKERDECARIADEWVLAYPHPSKTIAETIRARGQE